MHGQPAQGRIDFLLQLAGEVVFAAGWRRERAWTSRLQARGSPRSVHLERSAPLVAAVAWEAPGKEPAGSATRVAAWGASAAGRAAAWEARSWLMCLFSAGLGITSGGGAGGDVSRWEPILILPRGGPEGSAGEGEGGDAAGELDGVSEGSLVIERSECGGLKVGSLNHLSVAELMRQR